MTTTPTTPTSGAADLPEALHRSTAADGKTELFNLPGYPLMVRAVDFNRIHTESEMRRTALLDEMQKAALAAGQATAAQQGAYAALPTSSYAGRVYEEGFLIGTCPLYTADQLRAFADATCALRASHGQAPAGAAEDIDKALNVYAQAFAARVNGWTRQNGDDLPGARSALFAAIHAYAQASTRPTTSPQADSVQEEAARLDFLIEQRAYVVSDPDACPGYWLHWAKPDGRTWVQVDEHPTPRAAIDAARKQGGV